MYAEIYPFVARPLPYDYDALMPVLDEETLHFHHDKHYQNYVNQLNHILADYPELQKKTLPELLMDTKKLPETARQGIINNGGGVYNHELYFESMRNVTGQEPTGALAEAITRDFGSFKEWKSRMEEEALACFGSGWAWLVTDREGKLYIFQTVNQDVPDLREYTPLLLVDVWEHAYYLQYQNRRKEYVEGWFLLVYWKRVEKRYEEGCAGKKD